MRLDTAKFLAANNKFARSAKINGNTVFTSGWDFGPGAVDAQNYDASAQKGYLGFVAASDLITGDALATALSLTAGTGQNSDAGWLKFLDATGTGDIYYIAKKPFRYNVSRYNLMGMIGGADVTIGSRDYKVYLMYGGTSVNPGLEVAAYLLRVLNGDWASFTDIELGLNGNQNGSYFWTRDYDGDWYYTRAFSLLIYATKVSYNTYRTDQTGWRPMLKLVQT